MATFNESRALNILSTTFDNCTVSPGEWSGFDIISKDEISQHVEIQDGFISFYTPFGIRKEVRL